MGTYTDIFIHSFLQCIRTIKSCCCFSFFFSAPADPLAEDESTHTAGNGVVTEVGGVQACVLFCLFVSFCCHVLIEIFPPLDNRGCCRGGWWQWQRQWWWRWWRPRYDWRHKNWCSTVHVGIIQCHLNSNNLFCVFNRSFFLLLENRELVCLLECFWGVNSLFSACCRDRFASVNRPSIKWLL